MIKGLEHLTYVKTEISETVKLIEDSRKSYQWVQIHDEDNEEVETRLFSVIPSERIRGQKWKYKKSNEKTLFYYESDLILKEIAQRFCHCTKPPALDGSNLKQGGAN